MKNRYEKKIVGQVFILA